jgi:hypothetical protein
MRIDSGGAVEIGGTTQPEYFRSYLVSSGAGSAAELQAQLLLSIFWVY